MSVLDQQLHLSAIKMARVYLSPLQQGSVWFPPPAPHAPRGRSPHTRAWRAGNSFRNIKGDAIFFVASVKPSTST